MNNRMAFAVSIVLAVLLAYGAEAQSPHDVGIVYGNDHVFSLKAPAGWTLDNSSGTSQGLHAVFYRNGQSWAKAETVMYANTASKRVKGQGTLEELMEYDLEQFRKRSAALRVTAPKKIDTAAGKAWVRQFEGDADGNFEAVAYIDEKATIVMLVLSSRTKAGFDKAYADFEKLVQSYRWLASEAKPPQ